jgi:hypothetical protein
MMSRKPREDGGARCAADAQTSFVIAMIMPITTNSTIAACVQIHVGDMTPDSVPAAAVTAIARV